MRPHDGDYIEANELVIIGAGDWTINMIELFNLRHKMHHIFDWNRTKGETKFGFLVEPYLIAKKRLKMISSIGDPRRKRTLIYLALQAATYCSYPRKFINLIHPTCVILPSSEFGDGIYMQPHSIVYGETEISDHVSMCGQVNVGHHTKIGPFSTLCPHVVLAGNVTVAPGVFFGIHSKVKQGVTIGEGAFIGQGSNVLCDIPANEKWVGNPARKIGDMESW